MSRVRDYYGAFVKCDRGCRVYCSCNAIPCPTCSRRVERGGTCDVCPKLLGASLYKTILQRARNQR